MGNENLVAAMASGVGWDGGGGAPPIAGDMLHAVACPADQKSKAAAATTAKAEP